MMAKTAPEIREAFEELRSEVEAAGGVRSVTMGSLRNRVGAGRLADAPLRQINQALTGRGLAAAELSTSQDDYTLIYTVNSPIGKVIAAAHGREADSDKDLIRAVTGYSGGADPRDQEMANLRDALAQVRAIVSEDV